jgi:hypothetical protein
MLSMSADDSCAALSAHLETCSLPVGANIWEL